MRDARSWTARIVLYTAGSLGDLHPYLALGRELTARGHRVRIARFSANRARVEADGLDFHPVRPDIDPTDRDELRRAMHKRTCYDAPRATGALERLIADGRYAERAAAVGERVRAEDGVRAATDALEALLQRNGTRRGPAITRG